MNTRLISFLVISAFLSLSILAGAQEKVIHGFVTTFDSIPLPEAHIRIKSTKQILVTDSLGQFAALVNRADRLKVTASGFFNQKVKVEEKTKFVAINLIMKPNFTLSYQSFSNWTDPHTSSR